MDNKFILNLKEKIKGNKNIFFVFLLGAAALLLISGASFKDSEKAPNAKAQKENITLSYTQETEEKLKNIVSSISGAGSAEVMVTLESGEEQVFAQNSKSKSDSSGQEEKIRDSISQDSEYVLIRAGSKGEEGLLIKLIQPKIRGVAIVCEGGDTDSVKQEIIGAVTAVLDISSSRVYVTKMSS